ncbi:MAG: hypothetical protein ACLRR3_14695 [Eubacterium sp.]
MGIYSSEVFFFDELPEVFDFVSALAFAVVFLLFSFVEPLESESLLALAVVLLPDLAVV